MRSIKGSIVIIIMITTGCDYHKILSNNINQYSKCIANHSQNKDICRKIYEQYTKDRKSYILAKEINFEQEYQKYLKEHPEYNKENTSHQE